MKQLPLLVVVSGAPGSGKTTFADKLAKSLRLPHLERDAVLCGIDLTLGERNDRTTVGVPTFYRIVSKYLSGGVSLVIDGTLYKGISEADLQQLFTSAHVVNIHCRAESTKQRFTEREVKRADGKKPDWLDDFMQHLEKIHPQVVDPLVLAWQTIEVDTTSEYNPSLQQLSKKILDYYRQATTKFSEY